MIRANFVNGQHITPDDRDHDILTARVYQWDKREGARVGDYIEFADGVTHRFSHDWGKEEGMGIQTSPIGGSFYFGDGYLSYSGGLEPCIQHDQLVDTGEQRLGSVWFFHRDYRRAHNGINAVIPCRVFKTSANSDHWKGGR